MDIQINRQSRRYPKWLLASAAVALLAVGVVRAKQYFGQATAFVDSSQLLIAEVQKGRFEINVRGVGTLKPKNVVWLSSAVAGRVESIYKKAGATVAFGDAIAKLNNPQLEQGLLAAQSRLSEVLAEQQAQNAAFDSQLLDAQASLAKAQMDYEGVKRELDAHNKLRSLGNSTVSDLEYQRSAFNVKSAKLEWDIRGKKLDNLKHNIAALKQANNAKVEQLQSQLQRAKQQLDNLTIRANSSGVLQSMTLALGQAIEAGGSVGKIADTASLIAQIQVQELQIKDVTVGQAVTVDTRKSTIEGVVSRVDPQVIKGQVMVEVELSGALPGEARPELSVEGIIEITNKDNVLFVKKPHYVQDFDSARVFRLNAAGNLADKVGVVFGQSSVNTIEIASGLKPGERIIVSKTDGFAQNQQVLLR